MQQKKLSLLLLSFALTVLAAMTLSSCGKDKGENHASPATIVPANAPVYFEINVHPSGEDKELIDRSVKKLYSKGDIEEKIAKYADKNFSEENIDATYEDDVKPWLGSKMAVVVTGGTNLDSPNMAVIIESKDDGKVKAFLNNKVAAAADESTLDNEKAKPESYRGVSYYKLDTPDTEDADYRAVVGDFYVMATSKEALTQVIDTTKEGEKSSLAANEDYKKTLATNKKPGKVFSLYANTQSAVNLLTADLQEDNPLAAATTREILTKIVGKGTSSVTIAASDKGFVYDSETTDVTNKALDPAFALSGLGSTYSPLIKGLTQGSWVAGATPGIGKSVDEGINIVAAAKIPGFKNKQDVLDFVKKEAELDLEQDITSWVGDVGFFVRGNSVLSLDGGVVITSTDDTAASKTLAKITKLIKQSADSELTVSGEPDDLKISSSEMPAPIRITHKNKRVAITYGDAAAEFATSGSSKSSSAYQDAEKLLSDDFKPSFILDMQTLLPLIDSAAASDPDYQDAKPYLQKLGLLASGAKHEGDTYKTRIVLSLK